MIDMTSHNARTQLQAINDRVSESETAHDIAQGTWRPQDDFLLPAPNNDVRKKAWRRCLRQMQTLGPRIIHTKLAAAIGDVTWGGEDDNVDERLQALEIIDLAKRMARQLMIDGITAGLAHEIANEEGQATGETRITRLGGYLQPYTDPTDVDRMTGLYQAWSRNVTRDETLEIYAADFNDQPNNVTTANRWTVRIYDWSDGESQATIREWRNLRDPTHVGRKPDAEVENAPVPRLVMMNATNDGLPLGEILQAAPQLMALWATEARLTLSEELASFPMATVKGEANFEAIGAGEAITLGPEGAFEWSAPGNLEELRQQRALRLERIREDLALPGGFLGNDSPSGEAFREANVRFRQSSQETADAVQDVLTRLVQDYGDLVNVEGVPVAISPSKEYDFESRAQWVISLYQAGIIPLAVASREMQPYFGTWDDESLNEWIEEQSARVSVADLQAELE